MASSWRTGPRCLTFFFSEVFLLLWPKSAKTHGQTQQKTKKNTSFTPCPLSSFSDPLYGSKLVSPTNCHLFPTFVIFVVLMFGRKYKTLIKYIHWQSLENPSTFLLMSSLSYWFWLLGHQRKRRGKHLYHPPLQASGTPLYRCFLVCWCFGSSSSEVWLVFFEPAISIYIT